MTPNRRRRVASAAFVVAASSPLAGCGIFGHGSSSSTTLPTLPPTTTTTIAAPTTVATPTEYEVARGDTMRRIAGKFGVTVEAILALNPKITDPNKIQAGQKILIPPATTTVPPATTVAPAPSSTGG